MADPFGRLAKGLVQGRELRRQGQNDRLDQALKQAQLQESGYSWDGNQLMQTPGYQSTKALEREKSQLEIDKVRQELEDMRSVKALMSGEQEQSSQPMFGSASSGGRPPKQFGGPIAKSFKFGGQEFVNPAYAEYEREQKMKEPLGGADAKIMAGAKSGLNNIASIQGTLGLTPDEKGNYNYAGKKKFGVNEKILKLKAAQARSPRVFGVPLDFGITDVVGQKLAGDEGKSLELQFETLAENLLRQRSGGAVTPPEIVAEYARTLARMFDSPKIAAERLQTAEDYLFDTAEGIRPGAVQKSFGVPTQQPNQPSAAGVLNATQAKADGWTDEEIQAYAKSKGLTVI